MDRLISEEKVIEVLKSYGVNKSVQNSIKAIPSAEPKTGHWILANEQNKEDVENDNYLYICSKCRCCDIHAKSAIVPYCWKCGARMVEPQERSEE